MSDSRLDEVFGSSCHDREERLCDQSVSFGHVSYREERAEISDVVGRTCQTFLTELVFFALPGP